MEDLEKQFFLEWRMLNHPARPPELFCLHDKTYRLDLTYYRHEIRTDATFEIPKTLCEKITWLMLPPLLDYQKFNSFDHLINLKTISLWNSEYTYMSYRIKEIRDLEIAWGELPHPVDIPHIEDLKLRYLDLSDLPDYLYELRTLKFLDLSHNKLQDIPPAICKLKNLERLILGNNPLTSIPKCLVELPHLRFIDIDGKNLEHPDETLEIIKKINGRHII